MGNAGVGSTHRQIQILVQQGKGVKIALSPQSPRHFTVCTLTCEGGIKGVTSPKGKLRPRTGQAVPPSPRVHCRLERSLHCPGCCLAWAGFLPEVRPHGTWSCGFTPLLPSLSPFPSPAGSSGMPTSGSAPRSQEVRRRSWACLGTCCPFAGPVGDTRCPVLGDRIRGTARLVLLKGGLPRCQVCLPDIVLCCLTLGGVHW